MAGERRRHLCLQDAAMEGVPSCSLPLWDALDAKFDH
jgi:hypothetical protein